MRQIFLDTETTGLEHKLGHRIIEVGCVEMRNRRLTHHHFHRYLNPDRDIDAGALAVHGISLDFLQDKPRFADIADNIIQHLADRPDTSVTISIEIQAESKTGFQEDIQRTLKENANVLKFRTASFEED